MPTAKIYSLGLEHCTCMYAGVKQIALKIGEMRMWCGCMCTSEKLKCGRPMPLALRMFILHPIVQTYFNMNFANEMFL